MSEQPTKAAQIMALAAQGLSTRAIALEVYGEATPSRMAYVRIVVGQRKDGKGRTQADIRWTNSEEGRKVRRATERARFQRQYHGNPAFRAKRIQLMREQYRKRVTTTSNHA